MRLCLQRLDLMLNGTAKSGGVYLYANQQARSRGEGFTGQRGTAVGACLWGLLL